jgi:hypothetical protein
VKPSSRASDQIMLVSLCGTGTSMSAVADAFVKSFTFINFSPSNAIDNKIKIMVLESTPKDLSKTLLQQL